MRSFASFSPSAAAMMGALMAAQGMRGEEEWDMQQLQQQLVEAMPLQGGGEQQEREGAEGGEVGRRQMPLPGGGEQQERGRSRGQERGKGSGRECRQKTPKT